MITMQTQQRHVPITLPAVSTSHRDLVDDKFRDLRKPRKIRFYINGDKFFKGKKLSITPHRYLNFNDLMSDLTKWLPSNNLSYGVRQIFTPDNGSRVSDIGGLTDGLTYVCAGFEGFKKVPYGRQMREPWNMARPHNHDLDHDPTYGPYRRNNGLYSNNAFHPGPFFHRGGNHRRLPGTFGQPTRHSYLSHHSETVPMKPKVVTIVKHGGRPRNTVKILLNRRSVQSFEQLMSDVSEAFGPKHKGNKVWKLCTIRGKEVKGISDFFREDDVFIGVGNEDLYESDLYDITEELYPDSDYAKSIVKDIDRQRRKRQLKEADSDKRDSGFGEGSDGSNREQETDYLIQKGRMAERGRRQNVYPKEYDLVRRSEKEKDKTVNDEKDRARRRQQRMIEAEKRALDEERRKRGLVPQQKPEDPFKRVKDQKEKEREEAKRRREEEKAKKLEEEEKEKSRREQERERALEAARERQAAAEKLRQEKEKAEKERQEREKAEKEKLEKEKKDKEKVTKQEKVKNDKNEKEKEEKGKEDDNKEKELQKKKKSKSKIVRKNKLERQISGDHYVLSKYDLGKTLGDGNFAIVRQSKLKATGNEYAMKVIDKPKLKGKEHMVENEIEIMKDCNHPNIVKLYEEYETSDKIYLAMELVKGGDLFDAITQSVKFGEVDSSRMVKDLCNALFYLHSRSIVHRDLKPENLLVHRNKDGTITLKLADFGLAMDVREPIFTVCGTPTYVAPEILSEIGYGLEVDMWAVGVICYILLCGFPPFRSPDRNQTELFEFIKAGEYEFLSPYWDNISPGAKDLIQHLLIVDKKKRYTAIDTLSHPWIMYEGDMSRIRDNAELESRKTKTRMDLESTAKTSYESYRKMKEKRG